MAEANLIKIRTKIRRITDSPSVAQITDNELNEYINTFYQFDFPAHLRLFTNFVPFQFYTSPNVDSYSTNSEPLSSVNTLSDFKNRVLSVHPPIYIDGETAFYTQSPGEFYGIYPKNKEVKDTQLKTDGVISSFTGTLSSKPVQRQTVSFTSESVAGLPLNLVDSGSVTVGFEALLTGDGGGLINYETGAFTLNFSAAPSALARITSHVLPYKASRPQAVLYYANTFTIRPIPDDVYSVEMQIYRSIIDLLADNSVPELDQWWQYIAYGAAKKLFEDRMDMDSVQLIMPEFKKQEELVLRRTLVQQSNERTPTIYTENSDLDVSGQRSQRF